MDEDVGVFVFCFDFDSGWIFFLERNFNFDCSFNDAFESFSSNGKDFCVENRRNFLGILNRDFIGVSSF